MEVLGRRQGMAAGSDRFRGGDVYAARRSKDSAQLDDRAGRGRACRRTCCASWPRLVEIGHKGRRDRICRADPGRAEETIDGQSIKLLAVATLIPWAATLGSANPIHPQLALFVGLWIAVAFACFILAVQNTDIAITAASAIALGVSFLDINL